MFNFGGGMLTGAEIEKQIRKGNIKIDPFDPNCLNPNSYNLKLHPQLLVYKRNSNRDGVVPVNPSITIDMPDIDSMEICPDIALVENMPIIQSNILDPIDMKTENETIEFEIPEEGYVLQPGVLYIGRTVERTFTDKFIPMINGRSSGGRLGISIHICAGFGDIGFDGTWTLEITCVEPVRIYPNTEIAQVCYFKPYGKVGKLYRGRYFGQEDATASRFYKPKEY
jgi:dCTP deaminase